MPIFRCNAPVTTAANLILRQGPKALGLLAIFGLFAFDFVSFAGASEADLRQVTWQTKQPSGQQPPKQIKRTPSLVSQAATGEVMAEAPAARLVKGKLAAAPVRQTSFYNSSCNCSGPVCDCGEITCGAEPVCGVESRYIVEPGCGAEPTCGAEYYEPTCGADVSCGSCGDYCDGACGSAYCVETIPLFLPLLRIEWCRFDFFAGVQGFKGPLSFANTDGTNGSSRSGSGSFGFYEGFNQGLSLRRWFGWDMAWQVGVRATQSNLSGAEFTSDSRNQVFVTTGFFRRVDYGLQYGLVFDYLNDDWYFQSDLTQLRGELSWKESGCHVWGFQFAAGLGDDTSDTSVIDRSGATVNSSITFEPTDQYRIFYRRLLNNAGSWDAFAGWTDTDDGLIGASLNLPLRQNVSLATGATFLIPNEGTHNGGHQEESWNIALGLVYRPGGPMGAGRYSRPLFDVADNGTFMVDRR